ncbi:MAG TPA: type II toxin-antitoxin system RelE/ParE family toxin [Roseateles sp.]
MIAVRFLPPAEAELLHEIEYYSKAGAGTGIRFQAAVEACLQRAARHPSGGASSPMGTRSASELLVVAVAPHRRRLGYWLPRIG